MMVGWTEGCSDIVEAADATIGAFELLKLRFSRRERISYYNLFICDDQGLHYNLDIELTYDWHEDFEGAEDAEDIEQDVHDSAWGFLEYPCEATLNLFQNGLELRCGKGRSLGKVCATVRAKIALWELS